MDVDKQKRKPRKIMMIFFLQFPARMQQVKLKLNPTKWWLKTRKVIFMGFQLSLEVVSPAPCMVKTMFNMPKSADAHAA